MLSMVTINQMFLRLNLLPILNKQTFPDHSYIVKLTPLFDGTFDHGQELENDVFL